MSRGILKSFVAAIVVASALGQGTVALLTDGLVQPVSYSSGDAITPAKNSTTEKIRTACYPVHSAAQRIPTVAAEYVGTGLVGPPIASQKAGERTALSRRASRVCFGLASNADVGAAIIIA